MHVRRSQFQLQFHILDSCVIWGAACISDSVKDNYGYGQSGNPTQQQMCGAYESDIVGISIIRPCKWQVKEMSEIVSLVSPDEGSSDRVLETVDVSLYPTFGMGLTDFADFLARDFYPKNLGSSFSPVLEDSRVINGRESGLLVYDYFDESLGVPLRAMDVSVQSGDYFYLLTYTADKNSYEKYLPIVTQVVESLEIISAPKIQGESGSSDRGSQDHLTGGLGA